MRGHTLFSRQAAFTLVEILFTSLILAIITIGTLGLVHTAAIAEENSTIYLQAALGAQKSMEELMNADLSALDSIYNQTDHKQTFPFYGVEGLQNPNILTVEVQKFDNSNLYKIVVTLNNPPGNGAIPFHFQLESWRTRP